MKLRLATRGSALARVQSASIASDLVALGHDVETVVIRTEGDRVRDRSFAEVGAYGIFVREIEAALRADEADLAVHSFKDLPSKGPDDLIVAAVPERLDPADVLLTRSDTTATEAMTMPLRLGATVGTASTRRQALLRALRPDLDIGLLRGNVTTRLRALSEGRFDAIVLAAAGLARLERGADGIAGMPVTEGTVRTRLDPAVFVPAPAQGAVAIQVRRDDTATRDAVAELDRLSDARTIRAERAVLGLAEAGCSLAFGAWCHATDEDMLVLTTVLEENGRLARAIATGPDPDAIAEDAWRALLSQVPA
jgi:hydroxymethylbilane synthase